MALREAIVCGDRKQRNNAVENPRKNGLFPFKDGFDGLGQLDGGRTRARTWDPMIKSYRASCKERSYELAGEVQPTLNQRYTATEREQTWLSIMLFVNVFRLFR